MNYSMKQWDSMKANKIGRDMEIRHRNAGIIIALAVIVCILFA